MNNRSLTSSATTGGGSFRQYLSGQRRLIIMGACVSLGLFGLLKLLYPDPDLFLDSTSYIWVAWQKARLAYRPVGYSYFLRGVHALSASPWLTVVVQYLLFCGSTMFCFFSLDHLFGLPRRARLPVLLLALANPVLLLQANTISSDTLFSSLTVLFVTLCLWCIKRFNWWGLVGLVLAMLLSFEIRYTAMFYPAIAVIAILCTRAPWLRKGIGAAVAVATIALAVEHQKDVAEEISGTRVFSAFAGWQVANNALYCYKDIFINPSELPDTPTRMLDGVVRRHMDTIAIAPGTVGYDYLWDPRSPLKLYEYYVIKYGHMPPANAWFAVSTTYNDYGWYIIKNFPAEFFHDFIAPNITNYFYPDPEVLSKYDFADMTLPPTSKEWLGLDRDHLECRYPGLQPALIAVMPAYSLAVEVMNIMAICGFLVWGVRRIRSSRQEQTAGNTEQGQAAEAGGLVRWESLGGQGIWVLWLTWSLFFFAYMGFIIFATKVNLRFLDPMMTLGGIVPFALIGVVGRGNREEQ